MPIIPVQSVLASDHVPSIIEAMHLQTQQDRLIHLVPRELESKTKFILIGVPILAALGGLLIWLAIAYFIYRWLKSRNDRHTAMFNAMGQQPAMGQNRNQEHQAPSGPPIAPAHVS